MITVEKINERKNVIAKDIENVRARMSEYDRKKEQDNALLNALLGAFQQCDAFLKELDDDTPVVVEEPKASDVGNNSEKD